MTHASAAIFLGDCLDVLAEMPDNSVDSIVTDPPYALPGGFMGKSWDSFEGREDAAFAYWLSGLIDGEGHFAIKEHTRGTHAPAFALKMRADERGTLESIQRRLRIGTITIEAKEPNPMVKWTVQDKAGCQRLVDLLDKYPLRAKKRMDFNIWREAVCEWSDRPRGNRWTGPSDNTRMAALRGRLMNGRRYVDPPWSGHEFQDWCRLWTTECLRVLKPGGHLLAFGGSRTWHRLAVAIEDAGFEMRDSIAWLYGSGFPKSMDVSKAVDKTQVINSLFSSGPTEISPTAAAQQWAGWGTALKPAFEPIVVARKPLSGTVAANVLEHGTGALNIDGTRVPATDTQLAEKYASVRNAPPRENAVYGTDSRPRSEGNLEPHAGGRWPTNVVLDGDAAEELDRVGPRTKDGVAVNRNRPAEAGAVHPHTVYGDYANRAGADVTYGGEGGPSRFFPTFRYQAKAPAKERPVVTHDDGTKTAHPTVKPLALMRWLARLVTPAGGTVLDTFAGSGATIEAAVQEGFYTMGIEREEDYLQLIQVRLDRATTKETP